MELSLCRLLCKRKHCLIPRSNRVSDLNCPQRGHGHFRFAPMLMPISLSYPPFFILQIKNCYLADKKLPPEGASTLNLVANVARC